VIFAETLRAFNRRRSTGAYFVGYPKTGTTWVRFLIGHYLQRFCDLDELPLFDYYDKYGRCQRACVGPAMHFTHEPLTWERQTARDLDATSVTKPYRRRPVVLIARYPLDVLVSLWMQQRFRATSPFEGDLPAFVADPVFGLDKLLRFHTLWADEQYRSRGVHLLRYEDLTADTSGSMSRLLTFLGIPLHEDALSDAVEAASFASMRRLEESGAAPRYRSSEMGVFATGDRANPDALHVRSGTVGGYVQHLDASDARALEARVASGMPDWLGYAQPPRVSAHVD
jgi:hypothetical protein